jgi:integrase
LTSKDIDIDQGIVTLSAAKAKVRNRRIIELTEPAKRCLKDGKTMPKGEQFRTRFEKLRKEARIDHWPHDALRKTCASHFYNLYGIHKAVEQLGHSAEIMLRNYRQLVTKEQSEEWLEI